MGEVRKIKIELVVISTVPHRKSSADFQYFVFQKIGLKVFAGRWRI